MDAIDFVGTSTTLVTQLTGTTGPIKAGMTVSVVILACAIGLKIYKRFAK